MEKRNKVRKTVSILIILCMVAVPITTTNKKRGDNPGVVEASECRGGPLAEVLIFGDNFDSGNTPGENPVGWSLNEVEDADVSITGDTYVSTPYSVKLDNPLGSAINFWHDFVFISNGTIECWMKSDADGYGILTDNEANDWGIEVFFWNGRIMYRDPSDWKDMDTPFTYTPGTWYHVKCIFDCDTDTYDIYINDLLRKNDALMRNPSTSFNQVWFLCEYGYACTGFLEDVKIVIDIPEIQYTLSLSQGWNLITLPVENTWTAETLGDNITGCSVVLMFDTMTQLFLTHVVGTPWDDFPILDGIGYFIYVTSGSSLEVTGFPITSVMIPISPGWNIIGWYQGYNTTAESLGVIITGCSVILMFDAVTQTFLTHVVGTPWDNFAVTRGMGLFLYTTEASVWYGDV